MADTQTLRRGDAGYPRALSDLSRPPETLWLRGAMAALEGNTPSVAIVGARAASARAVAAARELARELARDHVVISGGALGVDGAAHLGALDASGATLVVLGSALDELYPLRHVRLFERVASGGAGALLSRFPPGTRAHRWTFPARNPLIAALARAVVVIEAGVRSGSLQTARVARELGRPLLAMAGSPATTQLIAAGANRVADADDVRAAIAGRPAPSRALLPSSAAETLLAADDDARVLAMALGRRASPSYARDLARETRLSVARVASALIRLELAGVVEPLAGGRYRALRG